MKQLLDKNHPRKPFWLVNRFCVIRIFSMIEESEKTLKVIVWQMSKKLLQIADFMKNIFFLFLFPH